MFVGLIWSSDEPLLAMTQAPTINIARPVLMLTDHHGGESFVSLSSLALSQGMLDSAIGSGTPAAPRGVSLALPNLLTLLDSDPSTGVPPVFSLPLTNLPDVQSGALSAVFTFGAKPQALIAPIDGMVPVNFVPEPGTYGLRIEVASNTRLLMTSPKIQIDLPAGAAVGRTRIDAAGLPWLDLNFLSLISRVTEGAAFLTLLMNTEAPAEFFIDFGASPFALQGQPVTRLSASVLLDKTPNFAPLMPAAAAIANALDGSAGVAFNIGRQWFFGADSAPGSPTVGFDVRDPSLNLAVSASADSRFTPLADWIRDVPRPILVAEPALGRLELAGGGPITFPSQAESLPSLDTLARGAPPESLKQAEFVSFGGRAFRALSLDELGMLEYRVYAADTLLNPNPTVHFVARDAAGALSGEMIVRTVISSAKVTCEVRYWEGSRPVQGVAVAVGTDLTESGARSPIWTDANGSSVQDGLDFTRYQLQVNRVADPLEVIASVDAADVLAALRLAHGRSGAWNGGAARGGEPGTLVAASPYGSIAADADGNGLVDAADANLVLEMALGKSPDPVPWRFVGEDGALPGFIEASLDRQVALTAVLPGDLDGSWGRWLSVSLDPGA